MPPRCLYISGLSRCWSSLKDHGTADLEDSHLGAHMTTFIPQLARLIDEMHRKQERCRQGRLDEDLLRTSLRIADDLEKLLSRYSKDDRVGLGNVSISASSRSEWYETPSGLSAIGYEGPFSMVRPWHPFYPHPHSNGKIDYSKRPLTFYRVKEKSGSSEIYGRENLGGASYECIIPPSCIGSLIDSAPRSSDWGQTPTSIVLSDLLSVKLSIPLDGLRQESRRYIKP
jgi:hypothetical protein